MDYGINNTNGRVSQSEIEKILNFAWKNNINTIDTAKSYGDSELFIGNCINQRKDWKWDIITKISYVKNLVDQIQDTIKKIKLTPIKILAHSADLFINNKFQSEIQKAKAKNLVSKIGVSLYSEIEINKILESGFKPDIIQIPMNILDTRLYRKNILTELKKKEIEIHVRSVFLQGLFYLSDSNISKLFPDALFYINKLKHISFDAGVNLSELSLLWLVGLEEVSKIIIGVDNASQLSSHLSTLKKEVEPSVFEKALNLKYENENTLNPSLWKN